MLSPSEVNTASKAAVNVVSRSRIRKRKDGDPLTEVHEVASGLGGPGCGRMSSHAQDVNPAGAYFHDEQDIESAQRDGVEGEQGR
jgi:hypothetical protein